MESPNYHRILTKGNSHLCFEALSQLAHYRQVDEDPDEAKQPEVELNRIVTLKRHVTCDEK